MKSSVIPVFCLGTILGLAWQPVTAADEDPFVAKYLAAEKKLLDRYVHNRKVVDHSKFYELGKDNTSRLFASTEYTSIFGQDSLRTKGMDHQHKDGQQVIGQSGGGLRIPGNGYSLTQGDKPDSYRIESHYLPPTDPREFGSEAPAPFVYPLMYGGDDGGPYTIGYVLRLSGQAIPGTTVRRTFLSASPSTWQGQPAVAIKVRSTFFDIVSTTYVDPANDYAALGYESDSSFDATTRKKGPVRRMGVLTYAPSAEGVPLPTKYEMWYILPDGRKVPNGLVEFLEYSKYTPTADDFDLEKQFGIKPLPPPGTGIGSNPATSRRLGWWLYGGAALFALLTAGLIIMRRRRRAASSAPQ